MTGRITRLEIEGYKSLKHVVWEPGKLNILIGPNGSGKSNLLRLLEMLAASAKGQLADSINKDGGLQLVLWDRRSERIVVRLIALLSSDDSGPALNRHDEFTYDITFGQHEYGNWLFISKESLDYRSHASSKTGTYINRYGGRGKYFAEDGREAELQSQSDSESALHQLTTQSHALVGISQFRDYLSKFKFYCHPVTTFGSTIRQPQMARYEKQLAPNGQNLINFLHTLYTEKSAFAENIDHLMKAAFGDTYEKLVFSPAADQYIQMRVPWKNLEYAQPAALLSDGILKFLFLASIFSNPDLPSLIGIDEPDVGFHPSVLHIIAEMASEASERTQVVLATHSPEFLNAIQDVNPDVSVSVMEWSEGETLLKNLSGEKLQYWLKEYRLGEMFRSGGLEAL